jgi:lysylphosphatidylglycerol synthetase-like protein (DUF2156 family)
VLLLLALAEGLRLGRRAAWWGAVLVNVVLATLGAVLALELAMTPPEQLLVFGALNATQAQLAILLPLTQPLLIAGLLLFTRRWFDVAAPAGTYRRLTVLAAAAFAVASTVYLLGGVLFQAQFEPRPGLTELLAQLPVRFVPPAYLGELDPTFVPIGPAATLLHEWTGPIFMVPVLLALAATFRRSKVESPRGDRARARALLIAHGGSSLSFLTTWRGNNYWFSPDGKAVVAYRVLGTVALAVGDPVGPAAARAAATRGFARFCALNGWTPCLYGITEEVRADAAALGWYSVQVAEETVLMLGGLAFTGRKWQDVRTAMNNAEKAGIRAEWLCFRDAPFAITDQIRAISEEWIADKGLPEMGFTLGGLQELADPAVRCLVAIDSERTVHGVTSWLPVYRDGQIVGWTLDFMRRRHNGFHGVMEFLIASAALCDQRDGAEFLSLSGAPLARIDRGKQPDALQRLVDLLGRGLEPVYGFGSLLAFKAKFQPIYRPLSMAYPDQAALPSIATAIGRAYVPHLTAKQGSGLLRRLRA